MKFLALPDGRRIDLEGSSYTLKNNQTLVINTNGCCESSRGVGDTTDEFRLPTGTQDTGADSYEFVAVTPGDAYAMVGAIDAFVATPDNISAVPVSNGGIVKPVEFIDITPNPWHYAGVYAFTVTGRNFYPALASAIWALDNGTISIGLTAGYVSPTEISLSSPSVFVFGDFTLYYTLLTSPMSTNLVVTLVNP